MASVLYVLGWERNGATFSNFGGLTQTKQAILIHFIQGFSNGYGPTIRLYLIR